MMFIAIFYGNNHSKQTMEQHQMKIVFLGVTGFPYKVGAEIVRIRLLAKALSENGGLIFAISRKCFSSNKRIPKVGHINLVTYIFAAGKPKEKVGRLKKALLNIKGTALEIIMLKRLKIDAAILSSRDFWLLLHYKLWSMILGYKIILNYTELNSALRNRNKNPIKVLNDRLFEKYAFKLLDGIMPISEMLAILAIKQNPGISFYKIPVLVDFTEFVKTHDIHEKYFIYCGRTSYFYIIDFIIKAFDFIQDSSIRLKFVLYGRGKDSERIKAEILQSPKRDLIDVYSELEYGELINLYLNAIGLLIPLKSILKDKARFPHKIGEYSATGRPIITTNIGEIKYYFTDMQNALVAESFDFQLYAEKMEYAINHPETMTTIGDNAKQTGLKYFDYKKHGYPLMQFIEKTVRQ
jgi:glycosyltransferase involved in cell wall biosynthesis